VGELLEPRFGINMAALPVSASWMVLVFLAKLMTTTVVSEE
jgi:hypothetical protein